MTGLQGELRDRIVGSAAHVYVFKVGGIQDPAAEVARVRSVPEVVGAAPVVLGPGMIVAGEKDAYIQIKGISPALENDVTSISKSMQAGSLAALEPRQGQADGILIGRELSKKLNAFVGDEVQLMTPNPTMTPFGAIVRPHRFKVVGIFSLGLFEYDEAYGFVHLDVAQRLLDKAHPDFIEVRLDDMFKARAVADGIPGRLGSDYMAQDWADINGSLFSALWLEKMAISITIGLIVMVAALNIVASLVLLVMEKSRDIAILKTMGSSAASIRRIFMLQGLVIGLVGTAMGTLGGTVLIYVLDKYKLIRVPIDVYQISYVPFTLLPLDFATVVVAAILICFVATIYPSRQASKLDPAQALRYQ
jgi:lipoprotein-releasing system permease protein